MLKEGYLEKMLFLLRRKKRKIGIERYRKKNQSIRRRELRTIPYSNNGKTEVDSEYATTDNEEHIQEQSNQDKSYFDSESIGNQSGGVRQREPLMDGPHPKVVESFKDV